jgi:hypothetical protein
MAAADRSLALSLGLALASPLGVQSLGRHVGTHDNDVHRRQSSTVSVEELACRRASQPFLRNPCVQLDRVLSELGQAEVAFFAR